MKKQKWVIEVEVADIWVQDGFDPDSEQFHTAIVSSMLGYANDDEIKVKVVSRPKDRVVANLQGYSTVKQYKSDNWAKGRRK